MGKCPNGGQSPPILTTLRYGHEVTCILKGRLRASRPYGRWFNYVHAYGHEVTLGKCPYGGQSPPILTTLSY